VNRLLQMAQILLLHLSTVLDSAFGLRPSASIRTPLYSLLEQERVVVAAAAVAVL
jgi:hypothetical protein